MALVFSDDIWDRWRMPAPALAAAAIIVVPWLTLRHLQQDSEDAMAWVNHTRLSAWPCSSCRPMYAMSNRPR